MGARVWLVVYEEPYGPSQVEGVFSSEAKAQEFMDAQNEAFRVCLQIDEWQIDDTERSAHAG